MARKYDKRLYDIGQQIRTIRMEKGLSQTDLAIAVDTSRNVISKWESGEAAIRMDSLLRLCDELKIPPATVIPRNTDNTDETDLLHVQLQTLEPYMPAKGSSGMFWSIPITCKDPEGAMRFLDLMYDDTGELLNLILWGIEGEHYVVVDPAEGLIDFPEGIDSTTSGYYVSFGFYGNRAKEYIWDMSSSHERCQAYTDRAMSHKTKGYGFCYDPSEYADQIAAINAVEAQYLPVLESGSVDPETILPEFIQKLEGAGINEVIADKQAQFDAWLAQQ